LGKWLCHLNHEDGLVREEWRDSRLYVFRTDRGEVWHRVMKRRREAVSGIIRYTGNKMKPGHRRDKPPAPPTENQPKDQSALTAL